MYPPINRISFPHSVGTCTSNMGTSSRDKILSPEGKVTIIKKEERYPQSNELLMGNGFCIILLTMMFGLLPTSLFGSRLKYYHCSIAQAYSLIFGICMVILSLIFVPVSYEYGIVGGNGHTGKMVLSLIRLTHVAGFLLLLFRGYFIAKKMPKVWQHLGKLVQLSIVQLHGTQYDKLKILRRFVWFTVIFYIVSIAANIATSYYAESERMMMQFVLYHKLFYINATPLDFMAIISGFYIWKLCSFSHVLVSAVVGFLLVAVTVCLHGVNDNIRTTFSGSQDVLFGKSLPLQTANKRNLENITAITKRDENLSSEESILDEVCIETLDTVKNVHLLAEEAVGIVSKIFGVSLICEVLILIANLLVDVFYILVPPYSNDYAYDVPPDNFSVTTYEGFLHFQESDLHRNNESPTLPQNPFHDTLQLLGEGIIHSVFFYRLCCIATNMANEAKISLQILKAISCKNYSERVKSHIATLKSDLASTTLALTATNYFQVNKFTLTSVTSALTTYIIVLLQFSQNENKGS